MDALGLPVRVALGPGQQSDMTPACDLIEGLAADKAYDADRLYAKVIERGTDPVVPPKRNRKRQHAYDRALYKERNRIERWRHDYTTSGRLDAPRRRAAEPLGSHND